MSGGHFDYHQYRMREIADTIERDIARALKPKPAMIHEDYWTIDEMRNHYSFSSAGRYMTFNDYEEAEDYLLDFYKVEKATKDYGFEWYFKNGVIFESTTEFMKGTDKDPKIPVLYSIRHCEYDHYPSDADVLELKNETIETMKEAYRQIRIAEIYATHVDWMMSGDDGEDDIQDSL